MVNKEVLEAAKAAYDIEAQCITQMKDYFDDAAFSEAVELLADGSKVMVQHVYNDSTVYEDYNGQELFFGTVSEALLAGYDLSALLTAVKDGAPLSQEELMKKPDKTHVLITDVKADIYCPYKVTHVGDGVVYREDGSVNTGEVDGIVVILMK